MTPSLALARPYSAPRERVWDMAIEQLVAQEFNYRRDWLIGACAYRLQQQENMRLLYVCAY